MTRRIAYALLATLALLLVAAQGASAASTAQIHQDARDGYIDGDYTLAELRAANGAATAVMREYYGWDDIYQDALRRKANPEAPPVAVPVDEDGNGSIDPEEKAAAAVKTKQLQEKTPIKAPVSEGPEVEACDEGADEDECLDDDEREVVAADDEGDDDGGDSGSPLIWLIVGLPLLIVGIGAWRMHRQRKGSGGAA
jgi:hypothetical protein